MKYNILIMSLLLLTACSSQSTQKKKGVASDSVQNVKTSELQNLKTSELQNVKTSERQNSSRVTSKGIIESEQDIPVFSRTTSVIQRLDIHDGDRINAGQTVVWLDNTQLAHNVQLYATQYESAKFQYKSILVGQGYDDSKENLVPENIKKAARTRSQLDLYKVQLEDAKTLLGYSRIKAPISGIVTDLQVSRHDLAQEGKPLFRIVNPNRLIVDFTILESELRHFKVGTKVRVTPIAYADEVHTATVMLISPKVDENGMVRIKARIADSSHLMVGMNALVAI